MRIGGFQKFTLIDYPGKIAAIVFTQGCNFRCGYCHNPQLVCPEQFQKQIDESEVLEFLQKRRGKLEGVVVSGGEPTIHKDLFKFLAILKSFTYKVKLDTNGSNPDVLESAIKQGLVDFIAMDIKTSYPQYEKAIGVPIDVARIKASIDLIIKSGVPHQFRTTLVRNHCSREDLVEMQTYMKQDQHYVIRPFIPKENIIDPDVLIQKQYSLEENKDLQISFQRGV